MSLQDPPRCPGAISPVTDRTMRRCWFCGNYQRDGQGMRPAMRRMPDGSFTCPNEVPA